MDNVKRISRAGSQSADRLHRHPTPRATFPSLVCRPEPPPSALVAPPVSRERVPGRRSPVRGTSSPCATLAPHLRPEPPPSALVAPRVSRETDPPAGDPQSADGRRRDPTGSTEATPISVQWAPHPSHVKRISQRAPCPPTALPPTALPPPDAAGDLRVSVYRPEPPPSTLASPPVSRETDPPPGPRLPNDLAPTRPAPPRPPRSRFTGTAHPSHVKRISQRAPSPPTAFTATPRPSHLWSVGPATAFGSRGQPEADLPGGLPVRRPPSRHPTPQATFPSLVCRPEPPPSALVPPPVSRETDPRPEIPSPPKDVPATRPVPRGHPDLGSPVDRITADDPTPPRSRWTGPPPVSRETTDASRPPSSTTFTIPREAGPGSPTKGSDDDPLRETRSPTPHPNSTPERGTSPVSLPQRLTTTMGSAYHPRYLAPVSRETLGPGSPDRLPQKC